MPVGKHTKTSNSKSAKQKIDFNEKSRKEMKEMTQNDIVSEIQSNNNATLLNDGVNMAQNLRNRQRMKSANVTDGCRYHVQWTKEFMEKVRKSNERNKKDLKSKKFENQKSNGDLSLQVDEVLGDGILTSMENLIDVTEELDYEDDLSIEEEIFPIPEDSVPDDNLPGTSSQQINETDKMIQALAKESSEEKLMNNPVIQRMMEKFFTEKFKDVWNSSKNEGGKIKSPSDTTIYAPALQKKLTPTQVQNSHQINEVLVRQNPMIEESVLNRYENMRQINMNTNTEGVNVINQIDPVVGDLNSMRLLVGRQPDLTHTQNQNISNVDIENFVENV